MVSHITCQIHITKRSVPAGWDSRRKQSQHYQNQYKNYLQGCVQWEWPGEEQEGSLPSVYGFVQLLVVVYNITIFK